MMKEKTKHIAIYESAYFKLVAHCLAHDKVMTRVASKIIKEYIKKGEGLEQNHAEDKNSRKRS